MNDWILCSDKLPEMDEKRKAEGYEWIRVLAYANNTITSYIGQAMYCPELKSWEFEWDFDNDEKSIYKDLSDYVLAWQELPTEPIIDWESMFKDI